MSLFIEKSLFDLSDMIKEKSLSFSDIAMESVRKYEDFESSVKGWVTYDKDRLLSMAKQADETFNSEKDMSLFYGIPFGVKDIFNTRDFPTQMGSEIWKDFTPGNNARVVDSILNAGGILAGKTVTAEFAVHALNETRNPYDSSKTPGTSSSGSAVAVATGVVPYSLATQTAGSIIRPASFCGVWAMKPSFGLLPRTGVLKTTDSLDTIGFFSANPFNIKPILDQIRVKGPNYPFVHRFVDHLGGQSKQRNTPWKIGLMKTHTWNKAKDYAQLEIEKLAANLDSAADFLIEEVELPTSVLNSHLVHEIIYNKSLSYYFQNEAKFVSEISPIMAEMIETGNAISNKDYFDALNEQEIICRDLDSLLDNFDMALSLGTSSSAVSRGEIELPDPSLIWTLAHVPSISAPSFLCPDGLPFSCQFISKRYNDYQLIQGIELMVQKKLLSQANIALCDMVN